MELYSLTIHELHELIRKREVTSQEATESVLKRMESVEEKVNSYITVTKELAMKQAKQADEKVKQGKGSTLTGIPLAIKDILCIKGVKTTCGSRILEDFIAPYDAT
ncbi:MAG: Asp-tRNA(Asn)/Glu-tRNA(Gln) amidotransferase subunit GatA, partial [Deltaproteobacteria bacterium]|nr:Asp-tRNA(Asn)/Glu-tRNA(Gln) amidotransferase subunit GatA [Deltaproteobacteria bacterium]